MTYRTLLLVLLAGLLTYAPAGATDIEVTYVETVRDDGNPRSPAFNLTVTWENSWHTDRNHDAAWVFLKFNQDERYDRGYEHAYLVPGSGAMLWKGDPSMPDAAVEVAEDGTGLFVYADAPYRGTLTYHLTVGQDTARTPFDAGSDDLRGYGIEMVYVPEGPFALGDPDTTALGYGAYYRSDGEGPGGEGRFGGPYPIASADQAIPVGPEEGRLCYRPNRDIYQGDREGPIPATFPTGYEAFYLMKYEVTQGQYAAFLNTLDDAAAAPRVNFAVPRYRASGGTISLGADGAYRAEAPDRRNVYVQWDDMMAFADWAGLRPYTEFEYTKAARGPGEPLPGEYPWNTSSTDAMARRIDPATQAVVMLDGLTEADLTDANRVRFGASYYWVMDLAGSMWEKVVTPSDSVGRAFAGQHGDGVLGGYGFANVEGWPAGYRDSDGGYGYRGGGYYARGAFISDFNPFSPIAYRRYGAWSAGTRNAAYGFRAARTAP